MTAHEVLVGARNLIEREGWSHDGSPPGHCVIQAIYWVDGVSGMDGEPYRVLADLLGLDDRYAIPCWNDAEGRTKEEVLAAFDCAIAATAPEPDVSFVTEPVAA